MKRLAPVAFAAFAVALAASSVPAQMLEFQPLAAQAQRVVETLDYLGAPLSGGDRKTVLDLARGMPSERSTAEIQRVLDRYALYQVNINPESRVKVAPGAARPELVEGGWRTFLVKVTNEAGVTAPLGVDSPNAGKLAGSKAKDVPNRWLEILPYVAQPM